MLWLLIEYALAPGPSPDGGVRGGGLESELDTEETVDGECGGWYMSYALIGFGMCTNEDEVESRLRALRERSILSVLDAADADADE